MKYNPESFRQAIESRDYLNKRALTAKLGISPNTFSKYMNAQSVPTAEVLAKLATEFNLLITHFFTEG